MYEHAHVHTYDADPHRVREGDPAEAWRQVCAQGRARRAAVALLDPEPAPAASGCITGQPCALGCGLFCALEPTDTAPRMGGACRSCGASSWACFSSGPCCAGCDH